MAIDPGTILGAGGVMVAACGLAFGAIRSHVGNKLEQFEAHRLKFAEDAATARGAFDTYRAKSEGEWKLLDERLKNQEEDGRSLDAALKALTGKVDGLSSATKDLGNELTTAVERIGFQIQTAVSELKGEVHELVRSSEDRLKHDSTKPPAG